MLAVFLKFPMTACELSSIWRCSTRTYCDPPFRSRRNISTKIAKLRDNRLAAGEAARTAPVMLLPSQ
jgi:hypothetical protein